MHSDLNQLDARDVYRGAEHANDLAASQAFVGDAARWVVGDDGTGVIKGYSVHKFHPIARRLIEKNLGLYK
ncbi:hypothetical protein B0H11DRAFT_2262681 [Mycena galericulata]|nr:hypothetical protein B0H11DRAFT_2262681 [Mycena galericulata]